MLPKGRADPVAEQSLDPRLSSIVERAARESGALYAALLLSNQVSTDLRTAAWYGPSEAPDGLPAVARWVMARAEPLLCKDEADARKTVGRSLAKRALPLIAVPVTGKAASLGVLAVGSLPSETPYAGERDGLSRWLPLLQLAADLAGAVLENGALQRDLLRKEEQVQDHIRDMLDALESERERICFEVHDGVAQTLVSAFQYLQALEASEGTQARQLLLRATALVKQAIQESREVINSLQPATLMDLGLAATLHQEMQQLEQETEWEVDLEADSIRLPRNVETGLYRLIHEAITNAKRHSQTQRLRVKLNSADSRLKVEVRDWGVGFYLPPVDRRRVLKRRGTGLVSVRKRAELLQGTCEIQSSPGQGTAVRVDIPLTTHAEPHG